MNVIPSITGAILNTLWQSLILGFIVWATLRLLQTRLNAATRHVVWWIALVAVLLLPIVPRTNTAERASQPRLNPALQHELPATVSAPFAPPIPQAVVTVPHEGAAVWPLVVFAVWAAAFAFGGLRIVRSYLHLRGVKKRAARWTHPLPAICRRARLLVSNEITSPIAVGFIHPAVIMPEKLREQLTVEELNCALLHESAHLARYDDWLNLIGRVAGSVMALHPVVWWVLRQIEREREIACDDWVVAHTGTVYSYAASLARIAELRMGRFDSVLASGILTSRSRLRARIELLLLRGRRFSPVAALRPIGIAGLVLAGLGVAGAMAPHWIAFAQKLEFEVASIRENTTNGESDLSGPRRSGNLIVMHNTRIFSLINYAYKITANYQRVGSDKFPESWKWYDFEAKAPMSATDDEVRLMFQTLLADRFKLKVHRETREIPEVALVVDRGKPKLQPSRGEPVKLTIEGKTFTQDPGTCSTSVWHEGLHWVCVAVKMDRITSNVGAAMSAPAVDRTGLTGTYDLHVRYLRDDMKLDPDVLPGPSFEQALREELGLRLEKGKGPVEVLVIDHVEKPSEN